MVWGSAACLPLVEIYEVQNFQTAVKDYMTGKEKNLSRLLEYAEKLKIRDEVMKYVEVLV